MQWKLVAGIALAVAYPARADQLQELFAEPDMVEALDEMTPRPWCDAARLNPTEQTICADRDLSRLDALLELVYGRTTARDEDAAQLAWLRLERDACGTDSLCIARAYSARISQLDNSTRSDRAADP